MYDYKTMYAILCEGRSFDKNTYEFLWEVFKTIAKRYKIIREAEFGREICLFEDGFKDAFQNWLLGLFGNNNNRMNICKEKESEQHFYTYLRKTMTNKISDYLSSIIMEIDIDLNFDIIEDTRDNFVGRDDLFHECVMELGDNFRRAFLNHHRNKKIDPQDILLEAVSTDNRYKIISRMKDRLKELYEKKGLNSADYDSYLNSDLLSGLWEKYGISR